MSKEKQIEEIASVLYESDYKRNVVICGIETVAEDLYNAGYRKQSKGKWVKATPYSQEYCNQCGLTPKTIFGKLPPFCPNCGAKMRKEDEGK